MQKQLSFSESWIVYNLDWRTTRLELQSPIPNKPSCSVHKYRIRFAKFLPSQVDEI